jgi:hypothetical protein
MIYQGEALTCPVVSLVILSHCAILTDRVIATPIGNPNYTKRIGSLINP